MSAGGQSGRVIAAALPAVTVVAAIVVGVMLGVEVSILVVAAGALAGVIALLWASVQSLTGESPLTLEEALTLGAPSAEEEQKRSVLRALKDLEFERGVGKISEEDYAELSARYRAEAKRLMQLLDEGAQPERDRAEKALRQRLAQAAEKPVVSAKEKTESKETPEVADATPAENAPSDPVSAPAGAAEGEKAS